jgi:hypothetical protein
MHIFKKSALMNLIIRKHFFLAEFRRQFLVLQALNRGIMNLKPKSFYDFLKFARFLYRNILISLLKKITF